MKNNDLNNLRIAIDNSNIKYYVVKPYNTGFTDMFLCSCVVSLFFDSLGLKFKGLVGINEINRSLCYQDLYNKINFTNTYDKEYYSIKEKNLNIANII
ncbi:hypothetical protein ITK70_001616, partial [Campylobacter lari]|nr:hypothetical protein [Campylobacter lari]